MRLPLAALFVLVPLASPAASFDCDRARTSDERAICASPALNDQDVRMATLLSVLGRFQLMGGNGAMRDDQRVWLARRHDCGANRACIARHYATRVKDLDQQVSALAERVR